MKLRRVVPVVAVMAGALLVSGAGVSQAAGATINPNTQTTTGAGNAHWTMSWSGGTGTFYPNWTGSLGTFPASSSFSWTFDSCSAYTVKQELDVKSGSTLVASATSNTTVKKTNPC